MVEPTADKSVSIEFRILRQRPDGGDPPWFQSYGLNVDDAMTVLDALEQIRLTQDNSLMYRRSCHHSACGTCACMVNGKQRLACTTNVHELNTRVVTLEPLEKFPCLGDLVVDMTRLYQEMGPDWSLLKTARPIAPQPTPQGESVQRLENCIECGACVSACPVSTTNTAFMGPAALAALNAELGKVTGEAAQILRNRAASPDGQTGCDRALACSRVCPAGVYPARQIADLRRMLEN
jgi:succinate dehydrogenase / fumarate reductase iron-sulfur subunit